MDKEITNTIYKFDNEEDHKKKVGARIKELIKANNDTTIGIAKNVLLISRKTLESYEKGEKLPPVRVLVELCNHYDCELDYLLCFQDDKKKSIGSASEVTGLSQEAIEVLSNLREKPDGNPIDNMDKRFSRAFINDLILWDMLPKFVDSLVEEVEIRDKMKTTKLPSNHKSLLEAFLKYRHAYYDKEYKCWTDFEDALCNTFDIDKDTLKSVGVRPFDPEVYQFEEILDDIGVDTLELEMLLEDPDDRPYQNIPDDTYLSGRELAEEKYPKKKEERVAMLKEKQKLEACLEYWQHLFFVDTKGRRQFEIEQMQRDFIENLLKAWEE